MLLFVFFWAISFSKKKNKCSKRCPSLFYKNSTLINKCNDRCKKLGDSKKENKAILEVISNECIDHCHVLFRYSNDGYSKCKKKCNHILEI